MERKELNRQQLNEVVGGSLTWEDNGTVHVKNNPQGIYQYTDYYECAAWLMENWGGVQNEACLEAMAAAGLITRIG